MTDGVIYVATGAEFLDLARASAESLRATNPKLECDLFTDAPDAPGLEMFDAVHRSPDRHFRAKIDCMALTRFERTLYLDADTLVLAPFGDLFNLLDRFDLALAHEVRRASELIQEGLEERTPYAFPQLNSGVVLYRSTPHVRAFLADWSRRLRGSGASRDQVILKDMLWKTDLRFYVLPTEFNLRRLTLLDAWEPLDARPTIVHSHRLKDHMQEPDAQRVERLDDLIQLERAAHTTEWSEAEELHSHPVWRVADRGRRSNGSGA